jgi:hypothetical protein
LNANPGSVRAKTTDALRVRAEPNANATILGRLRQGADILLFARSDDGAWFQTQLPSTPLRGWISAEFLQVSGSTDSLSVFQGATIALPAATETPMPQVPELAPQEETPSPTPAPTATPTPTPQPFRLPLNLPFFP